MADIHFGRTLNAEQLLRRPSSQEALNLDEQVQPDETSQTNRSPPSSEHNQKHRLRRWWRQHVRISTPRDACRDHFGESLESNIFQLHLFGLTANERTALGYFRTAQAFAMLGVVIAQFMRLQRSLNPDPVLGFFVVSVPFSCMCHVMALFTASLGCYRFFKWQSAMTKGQAMSGGRTIVSIFTLTFLVS